MGAVLGISAFYHDSAACLVRNGEILAAAQEERFTRRVGEAGLPVHASAACLSSAGLTANDVDTIVFYEKPLLKLERILQNHLEMAPRGAWQWRMMARRLWNEKLNVERAVRSVLPGFTGEVDFVEHHEAHAASAFLPSPFSEAAILTVDGVGEWATAAWGEGSNASIALREEMLWPDSLGLLYSAITVALGFRVNRDEYKVMGLAAYGAPRFVEWIDSNLVVRYADGSCRMRPGLMTYRYGQRMVSGAFETALGTKLRAEDGAITDAGRDLAASVQQVLEEQLLASARYVARRTGARALCLAGGVAYNCVANGRLRREGPFDELWIQPAAGDAGGALGAALLGWYRRQEGTKRRPGSPDGMKASLLGPTITETDARAVATAHRLPIRSATLDVALDIVAEALAAGQIVAVATGAMEFGPRALGNRSILADPRRPGIQEQLNARVKHREEFRPFAPAVLAEHTAAVFDHITASPYMLETAAVRTATGGEAIDWRTTIGGAVHVDGSARLQTVDSNHPSVLRGILERFYARTGCPVLINTSFNDADMPIVANAEDACIAMERTQVDLLLLGGLLVEPTKERRGVTEPDRESDLGWLRQTLAWTRKMIQAGPRFLGDALLLAVFFLAVLPLALVYRLFEAHGAGSTSDESSWRPRERPQSDLSKLY